MPIRDFNTAKEILIGRTDSQFVCDGLRVHTVTTGAFPAWERRSLLPSLVAVYQNTVLQHLDPDSIRRLAIEPVKLELGHEMEFSGNSIGHIFFIEEGIGSMTVTLKDGSQVEAGMFGYESVVGVSALMGVRRSLNRVYMQLGGHGYMSPMEAARREFKRGEMFQNLALRYVQAQLTQSAQSAACNAKHDVEQRLARWLLICADRSNKANFVMSQEYLSDMLGISRPSVSIAAGLLKQRGLIDYARGAIRILDAKALEETACECYQVVKDHLDNIAEFDTGFVV